MAKYNSIQPTKPILYGFVFLLRVVSLLQGFKLCRVPVTKVVPRRPMGLEGSDWKLDSLGDKLDNLEQRLDRKIDNRSDRLEGDLNKVNNRFDSMKNCINLVICLPFAYLTFLWVKGIEICALAYVRK